MFGEKADHYIVRPMGDENNYRKDIMTKGLFTNAIQKIEISPRSTIAHIQSNAIKNVRVVLHYEAPNSIAVWPELHEKVTEFRAQPWMAFTLFSVFGTVYYRCNECSLECTALRKLQHLKAISKITRNEESFGTIKHIQIYNYNIMRTLGRYVQVTPNGTLEKLLAVQFRNIVKVIPRSEEMPGVMYVVVKSVENFISTASRTNITHTPPVVHPVNCLQWMRMQTCRLNLHVTHSGNVTLNYAWSDTIPQILESDIDTAVSAMHTVCDMVMDILLQLC